MRVLWITLCASVLCGCASDVQNRGASKAEQRHEEVAKMREHLESLKARGLITPDNYEKSKGNLDDIEKR